MPSNCVSPCYQLQAYNSAMHLRTRVLEASAPAGAQWHRSWSGYNTYREAHPNKQDPLMRFHGECTSLTGHRVAMPGYNMLRSAFQSRACW